MITSRDPCAASAVRDDLRMALEFFGFRVSGFELRSWGVRFRILRLGLRVLNLEWRFPGYDYGVSAL
jgi:hypothetical protein